MSHFFYFINLITIKKNERLIEIQSQLQTPPETEKSHKPGRVFKFIVKGPTEHAKFSVPYVDNQPVQVLPKSRPQPNPRRSAEVNQKLYNNAKPVKPVPMARRKSNSDLIDEKPEYPKQPPLGTKPPVKSKPVNKWKEPPLATAASAKSQVLKTFTIN